MPVCLWKRGWVYIYIEREREKERRGIEREGGGEREGGREREREGEREGERESTDLQAGARRSRQTVHLLGLQVAARPHYIYGG